MNITLKPLLMNEKKGLLKGLVADLKQDSEDNREVGLREHGCHVAEMARKPRADASSRTEMACNNFLANSGGRRGGRAG
jgi:hypothetical protein